MTRGWLLNLDAERELADPTRTANPFSALEHRPQLASALGSLIGKDQVLTRGMRAGERGCLPSGSPGLAWCPTPRALMALARAGLVPSPAPTGEVLRYVNSRAFSASLGPTLEGARFVTTQAEALAHISRPSPSGAWILKRAFGFAGHGRAVAPPVNDALRRFIHKSVATDGGIQVEPFVLRELDFSIHGFLDERGGLTAGSPTVQLVTPQGAWRATRLAMANELTDAEDGRLRAEVSRVAVALAKAGYFGPFGIDAFRFVESGVTKLQSRCEINARYTMGWAIGMGDRRPEGS